jgi:hypothetical protein
MIGRLGRAVRAVVSIGRDRVSGLRCRIVPEPARSVDDGWLLSLRVRNNGPATNFETTVLVHDTEYPDRPVRLHAPWRGAQPAATEALGRGASRYIRLAIVPENGGWPDIALLTVDESRGLARHHVRRDPVELTVVVRDRNADRVVAEHQMWISYRQGAGDDAPTPEVTFSAPAASAAIGPAREGHRPRRPKRTFRAVDVAIDVGLGLTTRTYGATIFDYNNDGWPDIFLSRHDGPALLFRNDHGHFVVDRAAPFLPADRHRSAAGDLTGDGRPDIFCVIGGHSGHGPKETASELWIQQPDGTFVNKGEQPGLADPYGRGREVALLDATGDGRLDILVGNVSPRSDGRPSPNRLFVNEGGGQFRPAPELGLDLEYSVGGAGPPGSPTGGGNWPMGRLATVDTDGNGWTDVVMCAKRPQDEFQSLHLFRNDEGRGFQEVTADLGLEGIIARDVAVADMTGDGQPDLVVVNSAHLFICLNDGGKFRIALRMPIEYAHGVAVADATGDGFPDIYVMRTSAEPGPDIPDFLLLNQGAYDNYETLVLPTVEGRVRDDDVHPIDFDRDGRFEFLVLHGHSPHMAPMQLITLV